MNSTEYIKLHTPHYKLTCTECGRTSFNLDPLSEGIIKTCNFCKTSFKVNNQNLIKI